jgi:Histidine kinase-like ATPase domain
MAVTLSIPADPAYFRLARLVASGYVAQLGGTVDEIDDLRTMVDELCSMLVAHAAGDDQITLHLAALEGAVQASVDAPVRRAWVPDELAEGIVRALADSYDVGLTDGRAVLAVEKRLEPASS